MDDLAVRRIDKNCNSRIMALCIFTAAGDLDAINRPAIIPRNCLVIHFESIIQQAYSPICSCFLVALESIVTAVFLPPF